MLDGGKNGSDRYIATMMTIKEGQIVGYRDNALIYSDVAVLALSDRKVDNVGAWGDILVLDGTTLSKANILTENSTAHTITMAASSNVLTNEEDFARLALAMQIDYSNNPILTGTFITKIVPPSNIWQALYEYLSSLKNKPFTDTRTDVQKLESAGFDKKTSFRNTNDAII